MDPRTAALLSDFPALINFLDSIVGPELLILLELLLHDYNIRHNAATREHILALTRVNIQPPPKD